MNTRSTQRFVGFVVVLVAAVLVFMAVPSEPDRPVGEPDREGRAQDARQVLPVFEVEDGWWVLTRYGMRMRLPAGWQPEEIYERPFAYRDPAARLGGSLDVLSLPNFYHSNLASLAEENRSELGENLISIEELTLGGVRPALRIDYLRQESGTELRRATVVFLLGGHQVVVNATAAPEEWDSLADAVRAAFESIELLDLPTMSLAEQRQAAAR